MPNIWGFLCQKIMELFALEFIFPLYFVSIKYVFIPFFFTSQFLELIFLCIGSYLQSYSLNKEYVEISSIKQRAGGKTVLPSACLWQRQLLSLENLYGIPPSMTCSGWVKPEQGVTIPTLPSKLSGTI